MPVGYGLEVIARTDGADGVALIDFGRPGGGPLPAWDPGAHIDVVLPDGLGERQYSLTGDPADRSVWRIGVLREDAGRGGSVLLHGLAVGDRMIVRGPANHFAFEPHRGRRVLFIAGGIGITPIAAMVRAAEAAGMDWRLVYAGRSRTTMAFVSEFVDHGRVEIFAGDEGRRADIAAVIAGEPEADVYCCGPARLIAEVEAAAALRSGSGRVHLERFEARTLADPVYPHPFEVECLLSGVTVTVPPERSILDVVEEAGVLALSSCRVGTCGTCETPIVEGEVDHRDSVLSPEEQQDDFAMMICVSRAACPRLVLEL